ncbi:hypothetical protein PHYSODRAFT_489115, partial [Phytophthora sojae]
LSPRSRGVAAGQRSFSRRPSIDRMSFTPSFIAMYSASVLDCALMPCFRDPYEMTFPSRYVT